MSNNLASTPTGDFVDFFTRVILPCIEAQGVQPIAQLVTEENPNNFPRLPVREKDRIFAWIARWPDVQSLDAFLHAMQQWTGWRDQAPATVVPALARKPEYLRLAPTAKSNLQ